MQSENGLGVDLNAEKGTGGGERGVEGGVDEQRGCVRNEKSGTGVSGGERCSRA